MEAAGIDATCQALWKRNEGCEITPDLDLSPLIDLATPGEIAARGLGDGVIEGAAKALGAFLLFQEPSTPQGISRIQEALDLLIQRYNTLALPFGPEYDAYGLVIPSTVGRKDPWEGRVGCGMALRELIKVLRLELSKDILAFLLGGGKVASSKIPAVADRHPRVREAMVAVGMELVKGSNDTSDTKATALSKERSSDKLKAEEEDWVRQAGAILSGQASTSLPKTDSRLDGIGNLLLQTLKVPSEGVQSAVSECLMTVSALRPKKALEWVGPLVEEAIRGDGYAVQRGAAYGLAGLAGGIGIAMLRETRFQREGALGIVEIIGWRGGRAFEAYAVSLVPRLLAALGDGDNRVREAAQAASTAAVSCMGSYARVRLLLPPLLLALSDRAKWRAQVGAAALMGALAGAGELTEAAAAVLPQAVPALVEAAGEAHGMVASAARSALERLGGVVQSPEISSLAPLLLQALFTGHALPRATLSPGSQGTSEGDPLGKALLALLRKVFLHRMDAPSLALVVPVVSKGLRASSAGAGKEEVAAQVVGAMASLADARDLVPYLPSLTKQLMEALGDAVPEVRAVAARSLGRLVEELGEDGVPGVTDLLKSALIDPATGGVERQGAAQGLAEVFAALGSQRLPSLLPDIVSQTEAPQRSTREGALLLLVYLPATAGAAFAPHLPTVVPAILRGLADEGADVRAASLRAARMIVRGHAQGAVHLLLPELEGGLFAESWRIRAAAVQLVGELLLNVGGASSGDEDEELEDKPRPKMPTSLLARLSTVLGVERRDRVLSSLYITRMDESAAVRHALLPVWKALVSNTPKTVREILEPIMSKVMQLLSDPLDSWRSLGGRVLGEMVRKLGERVVRRIVPILVETSCSEDATIRLRAGALRGLGGILNGPSGRAIVEDEEELVVRSVQQGLVAKSGRVRRAAAGVFDALVSITSGGGGAAAAVGAVVPGLLAMLETQGPGEQRALQALCVLVGVRAAAVLPPLLPTLLDPIPLTSGHSLSGRGGVVGVVKRQLPIILSALLPSLEASPEDPGLLGLSDALVGACASPDTLHLLMGTLLERAKTCIQGGAGGSRIRVVQPLSLASSLILLSSYGPEWVRLVFIGLATSDQAQLVRIAHGALSAIFSPTILPKAEGPLWVQPIRRSLRLVKKLIGPTECVAGFSLPKGLGPIMPIFTNGLLGGSVDAREQSALGMDEIIRLTEPMALKTYVTQMTGSLIRIMGERVTAPVKAAILGALLSLLRRCPLFLRPFLPQLQRSFVRALADPQSVRSRAAEALGALMGLAQAKVDPVITELAGLYHNTTDSSGDVEEEGERREGILEAISSILVVVGPKKVLGEASLDLIEGLVEAGYDDPRASVVRGASRCVGPLTLAYGDRTKVRGLNKAVLFSQEPGKALASIWSLRSLAKTGEALNQLDGGKGEVWSAATQRIQEAIQYGKPDMAQVAIETAGWMVVRLNLLGRTKETEKLMNHLIQLFSPSGGPSIAGELKRAAILAVKRAYKQSIPEVRAS
ncbi:MAG: armadillo-type protein [Piptocephalis tieghemiana]|nr:MAG: armadillo-type protein [Piptocephalis tieghemiana]